VKIAQTSYVLHMKNDKISQFMNNNYTALKMSENSMNLLQRQKNIIDTASVLIAAGNFLLSTLPTAADSPACRLGGALCR
jgi:hypothetical protein